MRGAQVILPGEPNFRGVEEGGKILGILLYDIMLGHQYNKFREKQLKARAEGKVEKVGKTEYFYDEETKMWYPMIDLPPSPTLPEKELFLRQIRFSGVSDISRLKQEASLQEEYREKVRRLGELMLKKTFDLGTLQKVQMVLTMTQGMSLEERNKVMDSLLKMLEGYEATYEEKVKTPEGRETKIKVRIGEKKETKEIKKVPETTREITEKLRRREEQIPWTEMTERDIEELRMKIIKEEEPKTKTKILQPEPGEISPPKIIISEEQLKKALSKRGIKEDIKELEKALPERKEKEGFLKKFLKEVWRSILEGMKPPSPPVEGT